MEDNFFIIDSDNLNSVNTKLYGYVINNDKIIFENSENNELSNNGAYIYVHTEDDKIRITQDYIGSYGLYYYQKEDYFAISNSFLKLMEYLADNHKTINFNKDYANYLMSQKLVSNLSSTTLIKEIEILPEDIHVIIDKTSKNIEFKQNIIEKKVPINSKEALDILDSWYMKWINIIRHIRETTNDIIVDLSGGFDSRVVAAIWLNSEIDFTKIRINTSKHGRYQEDFEIVSEIADSLNFNLNNDTHMERIPVEYDETITKSKYVRFGVVKQMYLRNSMPKNIAFRISGHCGEIIRKYITQNAEEYKLLIEKGGYNFHPMTKDSCRRLINQEYENFSMKYPNLDMDNEFPSLLYKKGRCRNLFGSQFVDAYQFNIATIAPLADSELQKIDYKIGVDDFNLLIALIMKRYCPKLLDFRFEGGREIKKETLVMCDEINEISPFTMPKLDFVSGPELKEKVPNKHKFSKYTYDKFYDVFNSYEFKREFEKIFSNEIYHKIRFDLYEKRINFRDILTSIDIVKTVELAKKSKYKSNYMDWINNYPTEIDSAYESESSVLLNKFNQARVDIKNRGNEGNYIKILEISDEAATSNYNAWMGDLSKKDCAITSCKNHLKLKIKIIKDGNLRIKLRSMNFKDKNNDNFPIYINFKKLEIDGENVLKEDTLVTFNDVYSHAFDVNDSQIIEIYAEWLPFDSSNAYFNKELDNVIKNNKSLIDENKSLLEENKLLKENSQSSLKNKFVSKIKRKNKH